MLPVNSLKELNEQIIQDFYTQHPVETTDFDYKRELGDLQNEKVKLSFLKDITAFANTKGGDLIIGVDESLGLLGIEMGDVNGKILQIETIVRNNTDPSVPGLQIQFVPMTNGKYILIIRIPKSYIRPHRVSKDGTDFFARGEAGNFSIKMPQLRNFFLTGEQVQKDISRFISERVGSILSNDTFFDLDLSKGVFILHILPIQSFESEIQISASKIRDKKELLVPIAHRSGGYLQEINNFDGLNRFDKDGLLVENYAQVFNSGVVECVNTWMLSVESQFGPYIQADSFARGLFSGLHALMQYLQALEVNFPIILHLEVHGIKGIQLSTDYDNFHMFMQKKSLRNDSLRFPSIIVTNQEAAIKPNYFVREIKIWMDLLWRAFGYPECQSYTVEGYQFRNKRDGLWTFDE